MPRLTLKHWVLYVLPLLLAVVGPFVLAGASMYLEHRQDLARARNLEMLQSWPDAVVEQNQHDFGVMDASAEGAHAFLIRNQGGGELKLELGATSPPSLQAELASATVLPGQATEVRVKWKTPPDRPTYSGFVTVHTNDTSHDVLPLTVRGAVRVQLAARPARLAAPRVAPDESVQLSTLVYSQRWPDLTIAKAECSIAGTRCELAPAAAESLAAVDGMAGRVLTLTVAGDLPSGPFEGTVRIEAHSGGNDSAGSAVLEIPITGKALRRLAVYGDGVQENGVVDLGIHAPGRPWQHRLVLKVRDKEPDLRLTHVETKPDFFRVTLEPCGTDSEARLYHLQIAAPAEAPKCIYRGQQLGELKATFDHPRIRELSLRLAFAIMPRQE